MSIYNRLLKNPLVSTISNHIDTYPTPINLTYLWGFGSIAGIALGIQIVTGVLLAMHYAPEIHLAFTSVEHIMRDVKGGVALRYIHANGASMFFIVVYTHMFRGLYYGSYMQPRANLWYSGVVIFLLMMATAFMGYVLPWGQMSFWGATVITNLFSAIPGIGDSIVQLLWGGFSVDNPTLNRFFSLHYLLPFIIAALAFLHIILLHQPGSNNPLGVSSVYDRIPFYPYFYVKDLFGFFIFVLIFSLFVVYAPNYMGHPDNYIEANPLVTPAHIVPEWYFLPFYAVLRSIPDKLGGVLLMFLAIAILAMLPVVDTSVFRSNYFKPLNLWFFWYFFADSVSLGWIGQEIVESPFIEMGIFVTVSYFFYFIPLLPLAGFIGNSVITHQLKYAGVVMPVISPKAADYIKDHLPYATNRIQSDLTKCFTGKSAKSTSANYDVYDVGSLLVKWTDEDRLNHISGPHKYILRGIDTDFHFIVNNLEIIQVCFVGLFILFLGIFFVKSGEFKRFLNILSFQYLLNIIITMSLPILSTPLLYTLYLTYRDRLGGLPTFIIKDHSFDVDHFVNFKFNAAQISDLLYVEQHQSLSVSLIFIISLMIVAIFLYAVSDRFAMSNSYEIEYPILVFLIHIGTLFVMSVHTLIEFVLALEIITLGAYILIAFERVNRFSTYAGVQYFIIGSIPSGLLVLSIGLLYKAWGSFALKDLEILLETVEKNTFQNTVELNPLAFAVKEIYSESQGVIRPDCIIIGEVPGKEVGYENINGWPAGVRSPLDEGIFWDKDLVLSDFADLSRSYYQNDFINLNNILLDNYSGVTILAILLLLFNFLFKLTAAPFHFWAPSVYGKGPIASVTFLSIFSKALIFFALYKLLSTIFISYSIVTIPFLLFCSVISVLFGMIGAFSEKLIKRFFVYSSMGHVGFMLIGLSLSSFNGVTAAFHYLPVYIITSFIMWFILLHMGSSNNHITHFAKLRVTDPLLGLIFALIIFSMSGIPPLGGFFVKLDILAALVDNSRFYTNYILLLFTVASFFYYLRIVKIIFFDQIKTYVTTAIPSDERLLAITVLFIILLFYMFIVQKPLLDIQNLALKEFVQEHHEQYLMPRVYKLPNSDSY